MSVKHNEYPLVSVVISTYNRPAKLDTALESVHAQTMGDFEVIVVDDCTPDNEAVHAVLERWDAKFTERGIDLYGFRLDENSGYQCMPKNKGIEMARGDYIAYLDDDNTWRPEHLAEALSAIESDFSTDMVYTRLCYHIESPELERDIKKKYGENAYHSGDSPAVPWNPQALSNGNYVDTSSILHSKGAFWRLVRETGYGWDETLRRFGDWNFVWRWGIVGNTAKQVDKVTVDYMVHADSMQIKRPVLEVPVCMNYAAYMALRKDRNHELSAVS